MLDLIRRLRKGLNTPPPQLDIEKLFPMFTPASFFKTGGWPGPFLLPEANGVGITWALALSNQGMRYLDQAMRTHWESQNIDWKAAAMDNLRKATGSRLFTHGLGRKTGDGMFACAMMHPDGWGPSRLLLTDALEKTFPEGYRVAIPEMSCGFAMSLHLNEEEDAALKDMIGKCHRDGTRPLAPGIFEAREILPDWSCV
jgi:hypothetical protein